MSNFEYSVNDDTCFGRLNSGQLFLIDTDMLKEVLSRKWYPSIEGGRPYLIDKDGNKMHSLIVNCRPGYEVDHINMDTLDNRRSNLRICTHQQNQINQSLQKNNTSGITGVSWYPPRKKYRARIKISQKEIHLGYFDSFTEAVQARNVGMECMFGEYGRYNDVPTAPPYIRKSVENKCRRFANLSVCRAFCIPEVVSDA